ncbi:hypothetical protein [Berryella wangjianweii]|uniref:hypothetical protein n=1 Tax=Berryella wangjianweii TaxID=2734634 RepID=UPI0021BD73C3|nr:hypothetical protein [Berryella wangjianweii]
MSENKTQTPGIDAITDGLKNVFLAGIGAISLGAEKSKEIADTLVKQGESTFEQSKELNSELQRKVVDASTTARETAVEVAMKAMSPEQRAAFAEKVAAIAEKQNAQAVEVEAEVEDVIEPVAEAAAEAVDAAAEAADEAVDAVAEAVNADGEGAQS